MNVPIRLERGLAPLTSRISEGESSLSTSSTNLTLPTPTTSTLRNSGKTNSSDASGRLNKDMSATFEVLNLRSVCNVKFRGKNYRCLKNVSIKKQVVVLAGEAGTGKTALVDSLRKSAKGRYIKGKFEFGRRTEPYHAVASACDRICAIATQARSAGEARGEDALDADSFIDELRNGLSTELFLLGILIPSLLELVFPDGSDDGDKEEYQYRYAEASLGKTESQQRFLFAFRRFFRIVVKHFKTLLVLIDDLQWADTACVQLINALVNDACPGLMIVVTYRPSEVDDTHPFTKYLDQWRERSSDLFDLKEIELLDLSLTGVTAIIEDILNTDESATLGLAEIVMHKTRGNPLFVKTFVVTLFESGYLVFNLGTLRWTWDAQNIAANFPASENVVDMLKRKMQTLPQDALVVLKVASCLGHSVRLPLLLALLNEPTIAASSPDADFQASVDSLMADGYFDAGEGDVESIRFVHDRIQQAASETIPGDERSHYFALVGEYLARNFSVKELDSAIFVVVDLLNRSNIDDSSDGRRLDLAELNLRACRKALELSAYESAAEYARFGVGSLDPNTMWSDRYDTTLDLLSLGAEANGCLSNVESLEYYYGQVIDRRTRDFSDKFRAYRALIDSLHNRGDLSKAKELSLRVLGHYHCRFPKRKMPITAELLSQIARLKMNRRALAAARVQSFPVMKDEVRAELVGFLDQLATITFMMDDDVMPLVIFRNLTWFRMYGVNNYTPASLATTSLISAGILDDFDTALVLGNLAIGLLDRVESRVAEARAYFTVYGNTFVWVKPLVELLQPLLHAYDIGMKSGDLESSSYAVYMFCFIRWMNGIPLSRLVADCHTYMAQLKQQRRNLSYRLFQMDLQMLECLRSPMLKDRPWKLEGDVLSGEERQRLCEEDQFIGQVCKGNEIMVKCYFGEHEMVANEVIAENGKDLALPAAPRLIHYALVRGISCLPPTAPRRIEGTGAWARRCATR